MLKNIQPIAATQHQHRLVRLKSFNVIGQYSQIFCRVLIGIDNTMVSSAISEKHAQVSF